jgi:hypothetical protein
MSKRGRKLVTVRNSAIVAASAAAAVASAWDRTHRHVSSAVLTETDMRVERLSDLRREKEMLEAIQSGLEKEWGSFAFLGFKDVDEMAREAGGTIFVVVERDETGARARGIVQTTLADVHGDPELLEEAYPSFQSLTSPEAWKNARHHGGDTAVLLQITTLGPTERGGGIGSLLRNAVLNMLPRHVEFALTTTPIDGTRTESIDVEDASTYTPAMRFHARGGANPARILGGYKSPSPDAVATEHGQDVVVMRYARDEDGAWPAKRPPMRVRSLGPIQERALRTGRRLRVRGLKAPRPKLTLSLPNLHRPSLRTPSMPSMPRPRVRAARANVIKGIRQGAARLRGREKPESTLAPPPDDAPQVEGASA